MQRTLWTIGSAADSLLETGARLLEGIAPFSESWVTVKDGAPKEAYLRSLPRLMDEVRRARDAAVDCWAQWATSRNRSEKRKWWARYKMRAAALHALFPRFRFTVFAYGIFLAGLEPLVREIAERRAEPAGDGATDGWRARREQIEFEQRISIARLEKAVASARRNQTIVVQGQSRLLMANVYRIPPIATEITGSDSLKMGAFNDGIGGLLEAIQGFDRRRQREFGPCAAKKIRRAIALRLFSKTVYGGAGEPL